MLKCTIDGVELEVKEGSTIIEAIHKSKMEIAHYCWHPGLSVAGVCRLCMVSIEGNPRLQIACNTQVTNGMKISTKDEKVKDAVKWGLDFHLINHPLDCPICDQAGECGLQDQYMKFGRYDSEMAEPKVKKHKVVDLGPKVVLDTERCILCSRCVRFTDEVSKTNELGIFNRGDRAEVGTFENRPLNNNYAVNTIDICPVGALTSKDFRFRQRVWFLKDFETVCPGCSTGCSVKVHYNKEGLFRVKPVYNPDVNGYWMCDVGRDLYKFNNKAYRLLDARVQTGEKVDHVLPVSAAKRVGESLRKAASINAKSVALVITGQYTVEECEAMIGFFKSELKSDRIFHWLNNADHIEDFDGLLYRGDHNPNTKGLLEVLNKHGVNAVWKDLNDGISKGEITHLVVAGPENQASFSDMKGKAMDFAKVQNLIWLSACKSDDIDSLKGNITQLPLKTFVEKNGTFVNFKGLRQKIKKGVTLVTNAMGLEQVAEAFAGRDVKADQVDSLQGRIHNEMTSTRGSL